MKGSLETPRVFISYSWTSVQHKQWVLELARRLSVDGIVVIIDQWDLKEGQDKHIFMEQVVNDNAVNKVLVICDREYQSKANNREGGVGTETQLISKEVYEHTGQEKFVPIIREYDELGNPCVPNYMASRMYIDLSSEEEFEENYQKLIRNLYNKPLLKKPSLGVPPPYITTEEQISLKTSHKIAEIKGALFNAGKSINALVSEYLDTFIISLEDFHLSGGGVVGFDDKVVESIEKMGPLREDFIDFNFTIFRCIETVDLEIFHGFFEKLISFNYCPENVQRWTRIDFDNYRFITYELFLNFMSILLKLNKYKEFSHFINSQYFHKNSQTGVLTFDGVQVFNHYITALEEVRNKRLNLKRVSVTADLVKTHATRKDIVFSDIIQTDLVLFYLTELQGGMSSWFPRTSVYNSRISGTVETFQRLVSRQHFEKVKVLLNIQTADELKQIISTYIEHNKNDGRKRDWLWDYEVPPLEEVINLDTIGTVN